MEELAAKLLPGDLGPDDLQGDLHLVARLGAVPDLLCLLHVKAAADHLVHHAEAPVVHVVGVGGLLRQRRVDGLKIGGLGLGIEAVVGKLALPRLQGVDDGVPEILAVDVETAAALDHGHHPGLGVHLVALLAHAALNALDTGIDEAFDIGRIDGSALAADIDRVLVDVGRGLDIAERVAVMAHGVGPLHQRVQRQGDARAHRVDLEALSPEGRDDEGGVRLVAPAAAAHEVFGLLAGQAADIHVPDIDIAEVPIPADDPVAVKESGHADDHRKGEQVDQKAPEFFHSHPPP